MSVEALADRLGVAERQALAKGLSEHTLHELVQVLLGCDPQAVTQIASEVLAAIPEYGDRAVVVALALVQPEPALGGATVGVGSGALMAVTGVLAEDGCYDFLHEGVVIGRLLWITDCAEHPLRGWWLSIPGVADELIYRVPDELFADLPRARARGVSMSLGIAQQMLVDRVDGLLDGSPKP